MTNRTHIFRYILLSLTAAAWVFMFLALASFSTNDWPSHAVYFNPKAPVTVQNLCGPTGSLLAYYCFMSVGQGVYPILLFSGFCVGLLFVKGRINDLWIRAIGLLMLSTAFAAAIHQLRPGSPDGFPEGNGGLLGIAAGNFLLKHFNSLGALLILLTTFLVGLLLAADELVLRAPKVAAAAYGRVQEKSSGAGLHLPNLIPAFLRRKSEDHDFETADPGVGPNARTGQLFDELDYDDSDDKKVLLNRHNLEGDEVELTYANDEPVAVHVDVPATDAALKGIGSDTGPAEGVVIPEKQDRPQAVINGHSTSAQTGSLLGQSATGSAISGSASTGTAGQAEASTAAQLTTPVTAPPPTPPAKAEIVVRSAATARNRMPEVPPPPPELGDYRLPAWDHLADPEHGYAQAQEQYVRDKAATLEQALREFGIDAAVVSIDTGPVITMYEIMLPSGMKVASITQLSNDIARALKATGGIRIVAPVPGKDTVGIEVPNPNKEKVRLKELFALAPDAPSKMAIPIYLGKDASGEALVTDLTKMPHCLIAGTTGSGKSVCINTVVMSIMYHQRPDHVKLILIDPKVVELKPFSDIPHLMCPPINDPNKAPSVLEWLCTKMDERYELLAEAGVRQIGDYNKLTREQLNEIFQPSSPEEEAKIPKFMPYIVVIIDELADLMMMSGKEVEAAIVRLAQKSRAVGIHVVLATQRPQANVVTGLIKSNMPSRIAFRVQSRMDSRIVLDQNGAELLLGQGDMLFLPPGAAKPIRSQGTYIDDFEVRQSVKLVKALADAQYEPELVQIRTVMSDSEFEHDDLYDDAVKVVIETKRGSVSLLQRRLSIGYARSSRLIERMAATGILGEYKGSQSREVMFTLEEWEAAKAQHIKDKDDGMSV